MPEGGEESVDSRRIEFQGAAWRFSSVVTPVLLIKAGDEIRVAEGDGGGMAGHVNLHNDFNASVHAVFLDLGEVFGAV